MELHGEFNDLNKIINHINNLKLCYYHTNYYTNVQSTKTCDTSFKELFKIIEKFNKDYKDDKDIKNYNSILIEKLCNKLLNQYKEKVTDKILCINNKLLISILDVLFFNSDETHIDLLINLVLCIPYEIVSDIIKKIGNKDANVNLSQNIKIYNDKTVYNYYHKNNKKLHLDIELLKLLFTNKFNSILHNITNISKNKINVTSKELDTIVEPYILVYGYSMKTFNIYGIENFTFYNNTFTNLLNIINPDCYQDLFNNFVSYLSLDSIKYLINNKINPDSNTLKALVKYIFHIDNYSSVKSIIQQSEKEIHNIIYFLIENNTPITYEGLKTCIVSNFVLSNEYLEANNLDINSNEISTFVKKYKIVSNLTKYKNYKPDYVSILEEMINNGDELKNIKKFVKEKKVKPSQKCMQLACTRSSCIPLINFLIENGCTADIDCVQTVINGITNRVCKHVTQLFINDYKKKNNLLVDNQLIKKVVMTDDDFEDDETEPEYTYVELKAVDFELKPRKKYIIGKTIIEKYNKLSNVNLDEEDKFTSNGVFNIIKYILSSDLEYINNEKAYYITDDIAQLLSFLNNNTIKKDNILKFNDLELLVKIIIHHYNK